MADERCSDMEWAKDCLDDGAADQHQQFGDGVYPFQALVVLDLKNWKKWKSQTTPVGKELLGNSGRLFNFTASIILCQPFGEN